MKETLSEYFDNFHTSFTRQYSRNLSIEKFFDDLQNNKFSLTGLDRHSFDESVNYPWLEKLEIVIEKIMAIASDPRSHIKIYKEVRRSEQAVKISNTDIIETLKVPKYWKLKGDDYLPEKVYTDTFDMELAIYENRFIVALVDKMMIFLSKASSALFKQVRYINRDYINGQVSLDNTGDIIKMSDQPLFDEYGLIDNTLAKKDGKKAHKKVEIKEKEKYVYVPYTLLTTKNAPFIDASKRVLDARKKLSHVLSTPFYKAVKKAKPLSESDIHITNMLAEDKYYAPCFLFYRELNSLMATEDKDVGVKIENYQDYVSLNLIKAFKLLDFSFKNELIPMVGSHVIFKNYELRKDRVIIELTSGPSRIEMMIKVTGANKKKNPGRLESKISLDIIPGVTPLYSSSEELEILFKKTIQSRLKSGYANAFIITANDDNQKDDVILCSPYAFKVDSNLINMIKSCLIFSEGDEFIYSNLCPVCGFYVDGEQDDGNCYCSNCESTYSIILKGEGEKRKETVWIKRLKNPNDQ